MIICDKCNDEIKTNSQIISICENQHSLCENCVSLNPNNDQSIQCTLCGTFHITRNVYNDNLRKHPISSESVPSSSRYVSCASNQYDSTARSSLSSFSAPNKPVFCPSTRCSKMISITQIESHLAYYHSKLEKEHLEFGKWRYMELNLNGMSFNNSHIIALLMVREKDSYTNITRDYLFSLMTARISNEITPTKDSEITEPSDNSSSTDLILLWISGNRTENLTCILEVYDDSRSVIYTYHGCIDSIRDSNKLNCVFMRKNFLMLNSNCIRKLTQNYCNQMNLRVLLSSKDG